MQGTGFEGEWGWGVDGVGMGLGWLGVCVGMS